MPKNVYFMVAIFVIVTKVKSDLNITLVKVDIIKYNQDYIENPKYAVFNINETHQAINGSGTLKKDLGMNLKDHVEIFMVDDESPKLLTSNDVNVCDILSGGYPELEDLFKFGNFSKCPMKKSFYIIENAVLDFKSVPDSIPPGTFLISIKAYDSDIEIMQTETTLTVVEKK